MNANFLEITWDLEDEYLDQFNVSTSACIEEIEDEDADPIQAYFCQETEKLDSGDPLVAVYHGEINKHKKTVAEGVQKTCSSGRSNQGKGPV
jgi:hypothetical protein